MDVNYLAVWGPNSSLTVRFIMQKSAILWNWVTQNLSKMFSKCLVESFPIFIKKINDILIRLTVVETF